MKLLTTTHFRAIGLAFSMFMGASSGAWAHKASDAYLEFVAAASAATMKPQEQANTNSISIKFSIALRDIDAAVDTLDANNDRALSWGEIRQNLPAIQSWVGDGIGIDCQQSKMNLNWMFESLEERPDGVYARLSATGNCPGSAAVSINYQLMKNVDATHRLLVSGVLQGLPVASVLSPDLQNSIKVREAGSGNANSAAPSGWSAFAQFFPEGVHHIATGYDHLAFLLSLLLPIVLLQRSKPPSAHAPARPGIGALMRTVTGFTIGHSVTLALATFGWIGSPMWVEPAIAISIGVSAWLNLYPVRWVRSDALAVGFGLIHGLGFSSIMREANVSASLLPWALAGFNLGVEAGQLVGVALWCGLQLVLARSKWYERVVVRGGSWALLVLASFWAIQRTVTN
jgi:HupE / UreJ protein